LGPARTRRNGILDKSVNTEEDTVLKSWCAGMKSGKQTGIRIAGAAAHSDFGNQRRSGQLREPPRHRQCLRWLQENPNARIASSSLGPQVAAKLRIKAP